MKRNFKGNEEERETVTAKRQRTLRSMSKEELLVASRTSGGKQMSKKAPLEQQRMVSGRERDDGIELNTAISAMSPGDRNYFDAKINAAFDLVEQRRGSRRAYNREYAEQFLRQNETAYEMRQNLLLKLYGVRPAEEARKLVGIRDHSPPPHPTSYLSLSEVTGMQSTENYERLSGLLFNTQRQQFGAAKPDTPINSPCHINNAVRYMEQTANTTLFEMSIQLYSVPDWVADCLRKNELVADESMLVVMDFILDQKALYVVRFLYGAGFERRGETLKYQESPSAVKLEALKKSIPKDSETLSLLTLSRPQFLALPYDTRNQLNDIELTLLGYYYYVPKGDVDGLYDTIQEQSFYRDGIIAPTGSY